jgi:hypothetical protein
MGNRFVLLCLLTVTSVTHAAEHFDGRSWWEVVKVLADDKYEGRNTGSLGERGAQEYLVGRLKSLGIQPAGTHGYYQPVDLRSRELEEANSSLVLLRDGKEEPLTLGQQAFFTTRVELAPTIALR